MKILRETDGKMITGKIKLHVTVCGTCDVAFGFAESFYDKRRKDNRTFYCPNGHEVYYPKKSVAQQALDRKDILLAGQATKIRSLKGQITKLKRKVKG